MKKSTSTGHSGEVKHGGSRENAGRKQGSRNKQREFSLTTAISVTLPSEIIEFFRSYSTKTNKQGSSVLSDGMREAAKRLQYLEEQNSKQVGKLQSEVEG